MKIFDLIINQKKENQFFTGIVSALSPLSVKIYPLDGAILCKATTNLLGLNVGSNVILLKIGNQFIITHVIGEVNFNYCILGKTTAQSIPSDSMTPVTYGTGTTVYDPLGMHSETTNNSRITIKKAGYYNITLVGRFTDGASGGRIFYLYKNGNTHSGFSAGIDAHGRFGGSFNTVLNLAVNDYLQFVVYQTSSGSLDLNANQFIVTPLII